MGLGIFILGHFWRAWVHGKQGKVNLWDEMGYGNSPHQGSRVMQLRLYSLYLREHGSRIPQNTPILAELRTKSKVDLHYAPTCETIGSSCIERRFCIPLSLISVFQHLHFRIHQFCLRRSGEGDTTSTAFIPKHCYMQNDDGYLMSGSVIDVRRRAHTLIGIALLFTQSRSPTPWGPGPPSSVVTACSAQYHSEQQVFSDCSHRQFNFGFRRVEAALQGGDLVHTYPTTRQNLIVDEEPLYLATSVYIYADVLQSGIVSHVSIAILF